MEAKIGVHQPTPTTEVVARIICKRILRYTHPIMPEAALDAAVEIQWREAVWVDCASAILGRLYD